MQKTIFLVASEKGGTGKSLLTHGLISFLNSAKSNFIVLDCDKRNKDVFSSNKSISTLVDFDDFSIANKAKVVEIFGQDKAVFLINSPASLLDKICTNFKGIFQAVIQNSNFILVWLDDGTTRSNQAGGAWVRFLLDCGMAPKILLAKSHNYSLEKLVIPSSFSEFDPERLKKFSVPLIASDSINPFYEAKISLDQAIDLHSDPDYLKQVVGLELNYFRSEILRELDAVGLAEWIA